MNEIIVKRFNKLFVDVTIIDARTTETGNTHGGRFKSMTSAIRNANAMKDAYKTIANKEYTVRILGK
jgi:F0F1-type ATP synthase gamma subunit